MVFDKRKSTLELEQVMFLVEKETGILECQMLKKKPVTHIVHAKQLFFFFGYRYTKYSQKNVGAYLFVDDCAVINAIRRITDYCEVYPEIKIQVNKLKSQIFEILDYRVTNYPIEGFKTHSQCI